LKILHIGSDSIFLRFFADSFRMVAPKKNDYLLVIKKGEKLKFDSSNYGVTFVRSGLAGIFDIIKIIVISQKYDAIVAHNFSPQACIAFLFTPSKVVKVWSGWGGDYYGDDFIRLLGPITRKVYWDIEKSRIRNENIIKKNILKLFYRAKRKCVKKIDLFSAPVPPDYKVFKFHYPEFKGEYTQLSYGSLEKSFYIDQGNTGKNILVGNSSSYTNNHLDIFEKIRGFDLQDRLIIAPLSYGDIDYRDLVIRCGFELFGDKFLPLKDFLPAVKYNKILSSCSIAIMGHKRQQGLGNICSLIYMGANLVLDEENILYSYFLENGANILSLQKTIEFSDFEKITHDERVKNKEVIKKIWGDSAVLKNLKKFLYQIELCKSSKML